MTPAEAEVYRSNEKISSTTIRVGDDEKRFDLGQVLVDVTSYPNTTKIGHSGIGFGLRQKIKSINNGEESSTMQMAEKALVAGVSWLKDEGDWIEVSDVNGETIRITQT